MWMKKLILSLYLILITCTFLLLASCKSQTQNSPEANIPKTDNEQETNVPVTPKNPSARNSQNIGGLPSPTPQPILPNLTDKPDNKPHPNNPGVRIEHGNVPKPAQPPIKNTKLNDSGIQKSLDFVLNNQDFVEIVETPSIRLNLIYASTNNFVKQNLYGIFNRAFLHRIAADKLKIAEAMLVQNYPKYKFVLYDALRPRSIQQKLWDSFTPPPGQKKTDYIAEPKRGSLHNFGIAVDISILDERDRELDMGTIVDSFSRLAQPATENEMLATKKLSTKQYYNRLILRKIMLAAGFQIQSTEWWHFNALSKAEFKIHNLKIVE